MRMWYNFARQLRNCCIVKYLSNYCPKNEGLKKKRFPLMSEFLGFFLPLFFPSVSLRYLLWNLSFPQKSFCSFPLLVWQLGRLAFGFGTKLTLAITARKGEYRRIHIFEIFASIEWFPPNFGRSRKFFRGASSSLSDGCWQRARTAFQVR